MSRFHLAHIKDVIDDREQVSCAVALILNSDISIQDLYNAVFKLEIIDVCLTTEDPQEVFETSKRSAEQGK